MRFAPRCFAFLALVSSLAGCGGSQEPSERDIWYTTSLRPGTVEPDTQGERELLARMESIPVSEPVTFAGQTFLVDAPYAAASGRSCRSVRVEGGRDVELKLACEEDAGWVFVPDVFAEGSAAASQTAEVTP